jgi:hypothetical protein
LGIVGASATSRFDVFSLANLAALVGVARFVMGKKAGRWTPVRQGAVSSQRSAIRAEEPGGSKTGIPPLSPPRHLADHQVPDSLGDTNGFLGFISTG